MPDIIHFHLVRWTLQPSGLSKRQCKVCGLWIEGETWFRILNELLVYESPDGCCQHTVQENKTEK